MSILIRKSNGLLGFEVSVQKDYRTINRALVRSELSHEDWLICAKEGVAFGQEGCKIRKSVKRCGSDCGRRSRRRSATKREKVAVGACKSPSTPKTPAATAFYNSEFAISPKIAPLSRVSVQQERDGGLVAATPCIEHQSEVNFFLAKQKNLKKRRDELQGLEELVFSASDRSELLCSSFYFSITAPELIPLPANGGIRKTTKEVSGAHQKDRARFAF